MTAYPRAAQHHLAGRNPPHRPWWITTVGRMTKFTINARLINARLSSARVVEADDYSLSDGYWDFRDAEGDPVLTIKADQVLTIEREVKKS